MNYSYVAVFLSLILLGTQTSFSQNWEAGISVGGSGYTGDLNQRGYLKVTDPAFGIAVKKNFDGYWALKFSLLKGKIQANDLDSKSEDQRNRGLNFFSPITEGSLQLEFNFFDFGIDWGQKRVTPYIYSGISYFGFNPQAIYNGEEYELKRYGTELNDDEFKADEDAYKTTAFALPIGAGIKFRLSNYWNISTEFGFRTAYTDYLDDVSKDYVVINPNTNDLNKLRLQLSDPTGYGQDTNTNFKIQRGDYRKQDTYFFALITLSYVFRGKNCPF